MHDGSVHTPGCVWHVWLRWPPRFPGNTSAKLWGQLWLLFKNEIAFQMLFSLVFFPLHSTELTKLLIEGVYHFTLPCLASPNLKPKLAQLLISRNQKQRLGFDGEAATLERAGCLTIAG